MDDWRQLLLEEDKEQAWEALETEAFPAGWNRYRDATVYDENDIGQWSSYGLQDIEPGEPRQYVMRFRDTGAENGYIDIEFEGVIEDGVERHNAEGDAPVRSYSFRLTGGKGVSKLGNFLEGVADEIDADFYSSGGEYDVILERS